MHATELSYTCKPIKYIEKVPILCFKHYKNNRCAIWLPNIHEFTTYTYQTLFMKLPLF